MMLLLLAACGIDNKIDGKDDPKDFEDDTSSFHPDTQDTEVEVTPEECNGVDDDGDGEVDEDFPDDDGNGRVDCLDETCPTAAVAGAGTVAEVEECAGTELTPVKDAFQARIQWQLVTPSLDPSLTGSAAAPLVVNLDDDNGDGNVDEDDVPEVVTPMFPGMSYQIGRLVVIDGETGIDKWLSDNVSGAVTPAVGDFDGDGWPDVATIDTAGHVVCYEGDGTLKWTTTERPTDTIYGVVVAADLDGDGIVEVMADDLVVEGDDGSTRFRMGGGAGSYTAATAADIDLDGKQEVLYKGTVYNSDGDEVWSGAASGVSIWPIVIQADSDDEAEVGWVSNTWDLYEHDGTPIFSTPISTLHAGPPCAGDFDGDGAAEVAWPTGTALVMAELDGTIDWQVPTTDASGLSGCSGYDLDGDGALEVLYADEVQMGIFDGRTGDLQWANTDHTSGTLYEYPTVADIDHDDHAEIVFVSNFQTKTFAGVTVLEHDGAGWPKSGTTWGTHDFTVTNINPDGSYPTEPDPAWLTYNLFRARPAVDEPAGVDLTAWIVDVCIMDCDYGPAQVQVQVANQGYNEVSAGVPLTIYAETDAGSVPVVTYSLPAIPAGTKLDGLVFDLTKDQIGKFGYTVGVDDDGTGAGTEDECDETNNVDRWLDSYCD